jgi:hypothetical protein
VVRVGEPAIGEDNCGLTYQIGTVRLRTVTPSARVKDRFVVVDAVGVCEQDKTDSHTLNRKPSATVEELLNYACRAK